MMSSDKPADNQAPAKPAPKAKAAPAVRAVTAPASLVKAAKADAIAKVAAPKPASKALVKVAAKAGAKTEKPKKPKLVRDSLTMPKAEYEVLDLLKSRATILQVHVKKTELIRAGIKALAAMADVSFLAAVKAVPSLKTGRPKKS
jgi:hypothetical protein